MCDCLRYLITLLLIVKEVLFKSRRKVIVHKDKERKRLSIKKKIMYQRILEKLRFIRKKKTEKSQTFTSYQFFTIIFKWFSFYNHL